MKKYLAAIVPILIAAAVFLQSAFKDNILDPAEVWQLVALVAGAIATFLVPLLPGKWAGGLKTGTALLAALATALVPFALQGTITPEQWMVVVLAVLNALGVEVGVQARVTDLKDPNVPSSNDPEGKHALRLAA